MVAAVSYPLCTKDIPACGSGEEGQEVTTGYCCHADNNNNNNNNDDDDNNDVVKKNLPKCIMAQKCVEACAAYGRVCPLSALAAGRAACEAVRKLKDNSNVFCSTDPLQMNKLNAEDLIIGEKLGEGGFSLVNSCSLKSDPEGGRPLAIKYLKRKVMVNQRQFEHGASDLAQEAHFLSVLDHPHIIKLHGVTAGSVDTNVATGKECGFFITVDRLHETLEQKLEKWREEEKKNQVGVLVRMTSDYKEKKKEEMKERVLIALQIADAIEYLHNRNIIFRDLKPDNIAFDADGVLKLFDFGLAKELKPGEGNADGRYELTGNTGSRRYMSPEVAKELPYNQSVDAYSFGIMLHELLTAEKPFYGYSSGKHMSLVVMGGERPKMDHKHTQHWPMNLQWLMKRCWSAFPSSRPDFAIIKQTLQDVLDDNDAVPDIRAAATTTTTTHHHPTTTTGGDSNEPHGFSSFRITSTPKVEPPPNGFASFRLPKRTKGKSHGSNDSRTSSSSRTSNNSARRRGSSSSPAAVKENRGRSSWGWIFRK